ncbi:sulfotransferase family protein [Photobacterium leiognathi]|uniref:sulfotransferase family protein n=1 Tax=Photobacterium leiognathi TaxID=553611 RepID=UPI00298110C4|nr:sulfotransferase [Photobacterium leiognathi]
MKKINLFIIGGQKCGTTALASFLSKHHDVCLVSGKEAHIFDQPEIENCSSIDIDKKYEPLLSHYNGEKWCCDATPIYSYWRATHSKIAQYSPDAKIIFMLRDPVERAVSQYQMEHKRGNESVGILSAFLLEKWRLYRANQSQSLTSSWRTHSYIDRGFFSQQYQQLLMHFRPEQILIIHNEQLKKKHHETLKRVFDFLAIENQDIQPKTVFSSKFKVSGLQTTIAKAFAKWRLRDEIKFVDRYR